jgi:hypothetical protein
MFVLIFINSWQPMPELIPVPECMPIPEHPEINMTGHAVIITFILFSGYRARPVYFS